MKTAFLLRASPEAFEATGIEQLLHEATKVTAVQYMLPRGAVIIKDTHDYDHLSILAHGHVKVTTPGSERWVVAPACITIKAGEEHQVEALEDSVWFCVHGVDSDSLEGLVR